MLIYINYNFDFPGLDVYFENDFANEHIIISFVF